MSKIDFQFRVDCASRYHTFLAQNSKESWLESFFLIDSNATTGIPELLTLLHPKWHVSLGITPQSDPRGLSKFNANFRNAKCRSDEIWGYSCPYIDEDIHVDHTFPFSRGGSTTQENAMYLCREHNLSKSTDLHLIPWEGFTNQNWIGTQLRSIMNMAQRQTQNKLYFPENVTKRI
jgi:hypothetical protein